ncbi:immunity 49 family protein [Gordonia sp. CPCC 206044]|uniref:immunity 49 family protein n=1 Tax=Gordonia sp. CPCC 206044 TaxID=3140793 RepID=UPI003AF3331B
MTYVEATPGLASDQLEHWRDEYTRILPKQGRRLAKGWIRDATSDTTLTSLFGTASSAAAYAAALGDPSARGLALLAREAGKYAVREALLPDGEQLQVEIGGASGVVKRPRHTRMLWADSWLDLWWLCWITGDREGIDVAMSVPADGVRVFTSVSGEHETPWMDGMRALASGDKERAVELLETAYERTGDVWVATIEEADSRSYTSSVSRSLVELTLALATADASVFNARLVAALQAQSAFLAANPKWAKGMAAHSFAFPALVSWAVQTGISVDVQSPYLQEILLEPGWAQHTSIPDLDTWRS